MAVLDSSVPSGDVKSRLLPLPVFDAALERLVERLPRRQVSATMVVVSDIAVLDAERGEYKATGAAPRFEILLGDGGQHGGWFYIEAALMQNNGRRGAELLWEIGGAEGAEFIWRVTANLRGSVREVVYLPAGVRRLFWVPAEAPGFFSQSPLLIHRIGLVESLGRRLHRVLLVRRQLKGEPPENREGLSLWRAIASLQDAYLKTSELRNRRARANNYALFLARANRFDRSNRVRLARELHRLHPVPVISLVVPLRNPCPDQLGQAVDAVFRQAYAGWELILVCGMDAGPETLALASRYETADSRVKVVQADASIAQALMFNLALQSASGQYLAPLGQHDLLHPLALAHVALEFARYPNADMVYTDEDRVDRDGRRSDPVFKPDWNPDLLLSCNYVANLAVFRSQLVRDIDGCRPGFEGAEIYDLALRMLHRKPGAVVRHVAHVLYSGRYREGRSTEVPAQPDAHAAHLSGLRALKDYLPALGATASLGAHSGTYRVMHPLPEQPPLVSLIIPTRDRLELLRKCIEGIVLQTDYPRWEILVVDNDSKDPQTLAYLRGLGQDPRVSVLRFGGPFNYPALNNYGARVAKGEILGLLNNDLEVLSPHWLAEMVSHAARPAIGAVGAKLLYADGCVQHAGVVLGIGGVAAHVHRFLPADNPGYCNRASVVQNLSAVTGACLLVRKKLYWEVGGLDEENLAVAFNDIDFCLKLREAGYRNLYTPHAMLVHHESLSRGRDDTVEKREIFRREYAYMLGAWAGKLCNDPAYNANLTLEFDDFSLSIPS